MYLVAFLSFVAPSCSPLLLLRFTSTSAGHPVLSLGFFLARRLFFKPVPLTYVGLPFGGLELPSPLLLPFPFFRTKRVIFSPASWSLFVLSSAN